MESMTRPRCIIRNTHLQLSDHATMISSHTPAPQKTRGKRKWHEIVGIERAGSFACREWLLRQRGLSPSDTPKSDNLSGPRLYAATGQPGTDLITAKIMLSMNRYALVECITNYIIVLSGSQDPGAPTTEPP